MFRLSTIVLSTLFILSACTGQSAEEISAPPTPTAVATLAMDANLAAPTDVSTEIPAPSEQNVTDEESAPDSNEGEASTESETPADMPQPGGMGMGGGMDPNMRARHMAPIPDEYAGLLSPVPADADSLGQGETLYTQNCAPCHGDTGLGDGPAAAALDPAPPMIAMTSRMLGDDYLFWRISEGGAFSPFDSAMPSWKAAMDEEARWHVINYVRSLGEVMPMGGPGVGMGDAQMEQVMRAEMTSAAIEQGAITTEEAELFNTVHDQIDARLASDPDRRFTGNMNDLQLQMLDELVTGDEVSQQDADAFKDIHDRLLEAGFMQ